jgi:hypothetical protein
MPTSEPELDAIRLTPQHRAMVHQGTRIETELFDFTFERDLVTMRAKGSPSLPELVYIFRILEEVRRLHKRLYVLSVAGPHVATPSADHRRWVAQWDRAQGADAIAIIAPHNLLFSTAMNLIFRAVALFRSQPRPSAFFSTEADARAWILSIRSEHEQRTASPK